MQAFIQVNLGLPTFYDFQQPIIALLKEKLPALVTVDFDANSDEMLIAQGCRLVQDATQAIIYFKVAVPDVELGGAFRLVETIIRENKPMLCLLEGTHTRLRGILKARPHIQLQEINNSASIPDQVMSYLRQG